MDALHDPLVGCAGAMAPEQFDLNMIERVDIGGAKFGRGGGVTSNRDSSLTTQRSGSIPDPGSEKAYADGACHCCCCVDRVHLDRGRARLVRFPAADERRTSSDTSRG
jgi:hypothetical protein